MKTQNQILKKKETKVADAKKPETKKEEPKKTETKKPEAKKEEPKKKDDDDDDDDDDEEEETNDKKRKADEIQAQSPPAKKAKTENGNVPTGSTDTSESKKVFVGNLSYQIDDDAIKEAFKDVGEILVIDWFNNADGKFRGSGTLEFESHELAVKAKALKNGVEVLERKMIVDVFEEKGPRGGKGRGDRRDRGERGARGGRGSDSRGTSEKPEGCDTVYLGNLSYDIQDQHIHDTFGPCGTIADIRWVEKDGVFRGCGFLQFNEQEATDKAMALAGTDILGRPVRVDYAQSKSRKTF